jgi:hypothetical protein
MAKVDLYPQLDSSPSSAFVQTGTKNGQKGGSDVFLIGGVVGSAAIPADYDSATVSYPDLVTEIYTYLKGATVLKTVTITYTNSSKSNISGWVIT